MPSVIAVPRGSDRLPTIAVVQGMLESEYGILGDVVVLGGEATLNLRVRGESVDYFVKIADAAASGDAVVREAKILHSLSRTCQRHVEVASLILTHNGSQWSAVTSESGDRFIVIVTSFLSGAPLESTGDAASAFRLLGAGIGELDQALANISVPSPEQPPIWSVFAAPRLMSLLSSTTIADIGVEDQGERIKRSIEKLLPQLASLEQQWVHHDVNPSNVLMPREGAGPIRIIDFGDATTAPKIVDLAVAAAYLVGTDKVAVDPFGSVRELVAGYFRTEPLPLDELALVPEIMTLRYSMAMTITELQAAAEPRNRDYLLRNTQYARMRQRLLDDWGIDRLSLELRELARSQVADQP